MNVLDRRLAGLIMSGLDFTVDDLTDDGTITLDSGAHRPNGRQNGIGAYMRGAVRHGYIAWTGDVDKSRSPHRKGGMVRVWTGTIVGRRWAERIDAPPCEVCDEGTPSSVVISIYDEAGLPFKTYLCAACATAAIDANRYDEAAEF